MTSEDREEWLRAEVKSLRSQITAAEAYRSIALERLRASTDQDRVKQREFVTAVRELVYCVEALPGGPGYMCTNTDDDLVDCHKAVERVCELLPPEDKT